MIKIPEGQMIPRFYLPVKYLGRTRTIECYLFFIAPIALIYEKIANKFYYFWYNSIVFSFVQINELPIIDEIKKWEEKEFGNYNCDCVPANKEQMKRLDKSIKNMLKRELNNYECR